MYQAEYHHPQGGSFFLRTRSCKTVFGGGGGGEGEDKKTNSSLWLFIQAIPNMSFCLFVCYFRAHHIWSFQGLFKPTTLTEQFKSQGVLGNDIRKSNLWLARKRVHHHQGAISVLPVCPSLMRGMAEHQDMLQPGDVVIQRELRHHADILQPCSTRKDCSCPQ